MKITSVVMPTVPFEISLPDENGMVAVRLRENVSSVDVPEQDGKEAHTEWSWDEYILIRSWRVNLAEDIENNLDAWMGYGREADRLAMKIDTYQLRADTDLLLILNGLK